LVPTKEWPLLLHGPRECKEIGVQGLDLRAVLSVSDEEIADNLSRARDLTAAPEPTVVGQGQIEELEAAVEGTFKAKSVSRLLRPNGSADLAADVGELLDKAELEPAAVCESLMG
jgi:hypothetical protein